MRYHVLACDFDGTLAHNGKVSEKHIKALESLRASGRKLLLVTGRRLESLRDTFEPLEIFDRIVTENGAAVYNPKTHEEKLVAEPYSQKLVDELKARGVDPEVGSSIVAAWTPHEVTMLNAIKDLGLELHLIFNKGAIMALPSGVNKSTGMAAALVDMGYSPHNVVAVGDAENDHALLSAAECAISVSNAIPAIQEKADYITKGDHGQGVDELAGMMMHNDLAELEPYLKRHYLHIGATEQEEILLRPYGSTVLISGPSGSGKSLMGHAIIEKLAAANYQYCLIDPEGDFEQLEGATVLGTRESPPDIDHVIHLLRHPSANAVVNMLGIGVNDRPLYFSRLLPRLQELKSAYGRPHWLIVDEAHYLMPTNWNRAADIREGLLSETMMITVHPSHMSKAVLQAVRTIITVGKHQRKTLIEICDAAGLDAPTDHNSALDKHHNHIWHVNNGSKPIAFTPAKPTHQHLRHLRKYAEGDLGRHSFYFTGEDKKLNLKAQNLAIFMQIAEGIDDDTWQYHLKNHDYSKWFKEYVKHDELGQATEAIENDESLSAADSRKKIKQEIEERFGPPA